MNKKWMIFLIKNHVRLFCVFMISAILGFKVFYFNQPINWLREILGMLIIVFIGFLLMMVFWYFFLRKNKTRINIVAGNQNLQYECPACGKQWDEKDLPPDKICPIDAVPLRSYDPIEDRNSYPL